MADLGLIGAIGGLGKGLDEIGQNIEKRREQALEWAREEALYQRKQADEQAATKENQNFQIDLTNLREDRADARSAQNFQQQKDLTTLKEDRTDARTQANQDFQRSEREARDAAAQRLATLKSDLSRSNDTYTIRLRKQLSGNDVKGVKYGPVNSDGYAPVFAIHNDGRITPTGQSVHSSLIGSDQSDGL